MHSSKNCYNYNNNNYYYYYNNYNNKNVKCD